MASAVLRSSENYIKLILETDKKQARILIANATPAQVEAIAEIASNLLTLSLPNNVAKIIKKYSSILTRLAKTALNARAKLRILKRHAVTVLKILGVVKDSLLRLL